MIELDVRTRVQTLFDQWIEKLPIDGTTGEPVVTRVDVRRLACVVDVSSRSHIRSLFHRLIRTSR